MNHLAPKRLFIAAMLLILFAGCTTYVPPSPTDGTAATIHVVQEGLMHASHIAEIDGTRTSALPPIEIISRPSEIKVTPGRHTFLVEARSGGTIWRMKLWLN